MIDKVQISDKNLRDLHEKGAQLDPKEFNLGNIQNSGSHIGEIADIVPGYNLDALSCSGRHIQDVIDE